MSWLSSLGLLISNRVIEPLKKTLRAFLGVSSNAELLEILKAYDDQLESKKNELLQAAKEAEAQWETHRASSTRMHREVETLLARSVGELSKWRDVDDRMNRLHVDAERIAGETTVAVSDVLLEIVQVKEWLIAIQKACKEGEVA